MESSVVFSSNFFSGNGTWLTTVVREICCTKVILHAFNFLPGFQIERFYWFTLY